MDFVSDRLTDGRWFRILTVVDQYTRECLCIYADRSQTGEKVVEHMKRLAIMRGVPESITTDNVLNARRFLLRDAVIVRTARSGQAGNERFPNAEAPVVST
jgi:hypothetical protein